MEVEPGLFASSDAVHAWEPDPEVGGEMAVLCSVEEVEAGMSRFTDVAEPIIWALPARETLVVLEGEARIEIEGASTITLKAGDMASLPAGARTTWHLTTPFREFWVLNR